MGCSKRLADTTIASAEFGFALANEEMPHNTARAATDNGSDLLLFIIFTLGKSIELTFRDAENQIRAEIQQSDKKCGRYRTYKVTSWVSIYEAIYKMKIRPVISPK
ncbi:hypothetical protein PROVALCAL_03576 [Providencia alcalifaciens DSM 30120]|uniref:Uncharacterized protein n=1 Tax=Providencia alcalifaciens DSM 30120 TaxID=520999 RepID=B6XJL8_9GAMM|nr:hypothetical protein PROVALCAL_03576 [Providencia alcalifaciens DSM 30120]